MSKQSPWSGKPGSWIRIDSREPAEESHLFRPRRREVAGVAGRADLVRISFDREALPGEVAEPLFALIAGYDLVFGSLGRAADLLLSTQEIPDPEELGRDLARRFGGVVSVQGGLGAVSLIGFGLGSRPAAFFDALRVLELAGIAVLDSFTARESLSFLLGAGQVDPAVRALHHAFVENPPSSSVTDEGRVHSAL